MKTLSVKTIVKTGSVHEPAELAGAAHALEHCLFLSTPEFPDKKSRTDYSHDHGFIMGAHTDYTNTEFYAYGVEHDAIFHSLGQVVLQPRFGESAVNNEMPIIRREAQEALEYLDGLSAVMADYVMSGAPYGRRIIGFSDDINFSEQQLIDYYKQSYSLDKTSLLVVGDTTSEDVDRMISDHFDFTSYLKTSADTALPTPTSPYENQLAFGLVVPENTSARLELVVKQTPAFQQRMREQTWAYDAAFDIISDTLSDDLRNNKSLAYHANISPSKMNHESSRRISASVKVDPGKTNEVFEALHEIMSRTPDSFTDAILQRFLNSLRLQAAMDIDSALGRGHDYLQAIGHGFEPVDSDKRYAMLAQTTLEDVRLALKDIFNAYQTSPRYETVVGPEEAVGDRVRVARELFA